MSAIHQLLAAFAPSASGLSVPVWATGAMAYAISGDGSRVMGMAYTASASKAWVWSSATGHGESPAIEDIEWVFSTDASTAAAVSWAEDVFSVEMWDGSTHRSFALSGAADAVIRAISSDGNHVAVSVDGVSRIYSGVTGYITSGTGLTYRDLTPPSGYDYPNVFHISDAGDAYSTIYSTSLEVNHIGRAASAATAMSVVFDTYAVERYLPARDGADAVAFGSTGNLKLYNPTDGVVNIGDDIIAQGFMGADSVIYGNQKYGATYKPGVWTAADGWVFTESAYASADAAAVSPPDPAVVSGIRFLYLDEPDSLRIYYPGFYGVEDSWPLPSIPGAAVSMWSSGTVSAADLSLIFFKYNQDSNSYTGAYLNGEFVQMGIA